MLVVNFLRKPWLHFLMIGAALYILQPTLQPGQLPAIAAPTEERVAELRGQWLRSTGYPPTVKQLQLLIDNELDQEMLFQQALRYQWHLSDPVVRQRLVRDMLFIDPDSSSDEDALFKQALDLQLHLNDLVVRRRLIQRMEMTAFAQVRESEVDELALQQLYNMHLADYVQPPRIYFHHLFFSRDQHADPQQLASVVKQELSGFERGQVETYSDPFMHGFEFRGLDEAQIARYFGADFSRLLFGQLKKNAWQQRWIGPLSSSYGEHLVWIDEVEPAQQKSFQEVRKQILSHWRREQEQLALQRMLKQLRSEYGIDAT